MLFRSLVMAKYIDPNLLRFKFQVDFQPLSTDTYDEREIDKAVRSSDPYSLFIIAVQWAIIGMGGKSTGEYFQNGKRCSVVVLMDKLGVNYKAAQNSKLGPGELTPKRLARYFRQEISDQILNKAIPPSFLHQKYNPTSDPAYCFPGAEYLVTKDQAPGIVDAYAKLDKERGTNFSTRVSRIIEVRTNRP